MLMKYLIAIILPPLGMLLVGRIGLALVCLILQVTVLQVGRWPQSGPCSWSTTPSTTSGSSRLWLSRTRAEP